MTLQDLLLPADCQLPAPGAPSSFLDCLSIAGQVAAALNLADTTVASQAAAALQAATAAQQAQDREEAAFEASRQLSPHIAALERALAGLQQLQASLDLGADKQSQDAQAHTAAALQNQAKAAKYAQQQHACAAGLEDAGFCPEVRHVWLQARGRERSQMAAELSKVQKELERFVGLPADLGATKAATQQKREELARLRQRLQQLMDDIN